MSGNESIKIVAYADHLCRFNELRAVDVFGFHPVGVLLESVVQSGYDNGVPMGALQPSEPGDGMAGYSLAVPGSERIGSQHCVRDVQFADVVGGTSLKGKLGRHLGGPVGCQPGGVNTYP
jgi:hypothetical protein